MMIPSIDIMGGRAVQLVGGERFEMDCGDPFELAERFSLFGAMAVIDLDAAMGLGSNLPMIIELARRYPCRVGGGLRDAETVRRALDAGALAAIVGTKASPDFLREFPRDRLMAALDGRAGRLSVEGWKKDGEAAVLDRLAELAPYVGGFLLTSIEREGGLGGPDLAFAAQALEAARIAGFEGRLCFAGGVAKAGDIAALDAMGADAQVGMALYKGLVDPAEALAACMKSDRNDGLWPTVVCDERGVALGLAYSDGESLACAVRERAGVYRSRRRGLWRKGSTSGAGQTLLRVEADCDRDALRFVVRQERGFCHGGSLTCWGADPLGLADRGDAGFGRLERTVAARREQLESGELPAESYTGRLFRDAGLLAGKLAEEADELAVASGPRRAAEEAADLIYFAAVKLAAEGSSLGEAERVLDERARKVVRRPGDAKPAYGGERGAVWSQGIH